MCLDKCFISYSYQDRNNACAETGIVSSVWQELINRIYNCLEPVPDMAETDGMQPVSFPSWAQRTYGPAFLHWGVAMSLSSGLWNVGISAVLCFSAWSIKTFHVEACFFAPSVSQIPKPSGASTARGNGKTTGRGASIPKWTCLMTPGEPPGTSQWTLCGWEINFALY